MDLSGFFGGLTQVASQVLPLLERYGVLTPADPVIINTSPRGGAERVDMTTWNPPAAMPGGAPLRVTPAALDIPFIDILPQGIGSGMGGTCIQARNTVSSGYPSTVQFMAPTPSGNSRVMTYKNKGRALLYSDDLAACKRVKRVAARARRAAGGR